MDQGRIVGSVLGLALGDAFGAPYEGGLVEQTLWALIGRSKGRRRWTDDTQMTIDVIESLLACRGVDQNDMAQRFAASYRWWRGYGPGAAKLLQGIAAGQSWQQARCSVYKDGSFGNGGAMRSPAIGLFYAKASEEELVEAARAVAEITHGHALGQEGAVLIALATALAASDQPALAIIDRLVNRSQYPQFTDKLVTARQWLAEGEKVEPARVAAELGNGIAAPNSCPTAIYLALSCRQSSFDELLTFAIRLGGDVDTIAAMAAAIWGASQGEAALPPDKLSRLEQYGRLQALAQNLAQLINNR